MDIGSEAAFDCATEKGRIVVEVYADWCPDCRRIEGRMPHWAAEFADRFRLLRVNRDAVPAVGERFDVLGIPTFLVFEDGELRARLFSRDAKTARQVESFLAGLYA